jgi:HPt (histidine-containing phosphotransfer) domain-containing protein
MCVVVSTSRTWIREAWPEHHIMEVGMDLKALGENLGLEEDEFLEIVEIFLETAYADVARLEEAFKVNDHVEASEAAHSLKGSAGNLGFTEILSLSAILEKEARNGKIDGIEAAVPQLNELLDTIKSSM